MDILEAVSIQQIGHISYRIESGHGTLKLRLKRVVRHCGRGDGIGELVSVCLALADNLSE